MTRILILYSKDVNGKEVGTPWVALGAVSSAMAYGLA